MTPAIWIAGIGLLITFSTFLATVIYRSGHLSARVEELERWRGNLRLDMHEISEKLEGLTAAVHGLQTLIEERTERRRLERESSERERTSARGRPTS